MGYLLAIEWLKIKKYRTFYILAGMFAGVLILLNFCINKGFFVISPGDASAINLLSTTYSFPEVWPIIAYSAKAFSGLIVLFFIINVTNEYNYKTSRQNVIDGLSRMQFFHAKWAAALCLSLAITVFVFVTGFVFGIANDSDIGFFTHKTENLLYLFILTLNYLSFAMTLSFFIKRSGLTIVIFLFYAYPFEGIVQGIVNYNFHSYAGRFLPLEASGNLLPFPAMKLAKEAMKQISKGPSLPTLAIVSCCWIVFYYMLGRIKMQKSDW